MALDVQPILLHLTAVGDDTEMPDDDGEDGGEDGDDEDSVVSATQSQ